MKLEQAVKVTRATLARDCLSDEVSSLHNWLHFLRQKQHTRSQKRRHYFAQSDKANPPPELISKIDYKRIRDELTWLEKENRALLTYADPCYPALLKEVTDPPLALFAEGDSSLLADPCVAIVGSRKPTPVGQKVARDIAGGLAELGIVVVSGLAHGVDGISHQAALDAGGKSIAILGSAFDRLYPTHHRSLFNSLTESGLVLSEYLLGTPPSRYTFPHRNRIVSGVSMATVVVEAAQKSGTLITARLTMEQNRELLVVPGSSLSQQYAGSHRLIREGAALVCSADDVLLQLEAKLRDFVATSNHQDERSQVTQSKDSLLLGFLGAEPVYIDEIISASGLTIDQVSEELIDLELQGRVSRTIDGAYVSLE